MAKAVVAKAVDPRLRLLPSKANPRVKRWQSPVEAGAAPAQEPAKAAPTAAVAGAQPLSRAPAFKVIERHKGQGTATRVSLGGREVSFGEDDTHGGLVYLLHEGGKQHIIGYVHEINPYTEGIKRVHAPHIKQMLARHDAAARQGRAWEPSLPNASGEFDSEGEADEYAWHHLAHHSQVSHLFKAPRTGEKDFANIWYWDADKIQLQHRDPARWRQIYGSTGEAALLKAHARSLDRAIARCTLPHALTVYRGLKLDPNDPMHSRLVNARIGQVVMDKAVASTSIHPSVAARFTGARFAGSGYGSDKVGLRIRIRLPQGHHGLYYDRMVGGRFQREFLLPRGTRFRVVSHTIASDGVHEQVWEPVGEGLRKAILVQLDPQHIRRAHPSPVVGTDDENIAEEENDLWVSGRNGIHYLAKYHPGTRRIRVLGHATKALDLGWPADAEALIKARHFTGQEMEDLNLRWITVHPGGPGTEGQPVLVHDDGTHYTVVGGAGGALNQMVMQKPTESRKDVTALQQAKLKKQKERAEEARRRSPEQYERLLETRATLAQEIEARKTQFREETTAALGVKVSEQDIRAEARERAERRAREQGRQATVKDVDEQHKQVRKEARQAERKASEEIVRAAMNDGAIAALRGEVEHATPAEIKVKAGETEIIRTIPHEQLKELTREVMSIDALRKQVRQLDAAIRAGNVKAVEGVQMAMDLREPSDQELARWLEEGKMSREHVLTQTAVVQGSRDASAAVQRRFGAAGAADGLNALAAEHAGASVVTAELAEKLGVEGAARVTAEWMRAQGADARAVADKIASEHGARSYALAGTAIQQCGRLDAEIDAARSAAEAGDGSVEWSQYGAMLQNAAGEKFRALNAVHGKLRAAAALHVALAHESPDDLFVPGGFSELDTHAMAKGYGLEEGDYALARAEGGYGIRVSKDAIHKLALPRRFGSPDGASRMEELEGDVANGWRDYHQAGLRPEMTPYRHQVLGMRALERFKHVLVNMGTGTGKTLIAVGGALRNLKEGKSGIIIMPQAVVAKQRQALEQYVVPEMQGQFAVCDTGKDLRAALERKRAGEAVAIITTPDLMRRNREALLAEGIGGKGSFVYMDEAQQAKTAEETAAGGQMGAARARAAAALMRGADESAAFSATLLENDGAELWRLWTMVHGTRSLPPQKEFAGMWDRAAQSGDPGATAHLRSMLRDGWVSHHDPITRKKVARHEDGRILRDAEGRPTYKIGPDGEPETEDVPYGIEDRVVPQVPEIRELIAKANRQRRKERVNPDKKVRSGAQLRFNAAVVQATTAGTTARDPETGEERVVNPKMEHLREEFDRRQAQAIDDWVEGIAEDPYYRMGVVSETHAPFRALEKLFAGRKVARIVGGLTTDRLQKRVDAVNARQVPGEAQAKIRDIRQRLEQLRAGKAPREEVEAVLEEGRVLGRAVADGAALHVVAMGKNANAGVNLPGLETITTSHPVQSAGVETQYFGRNVRADSPATMHYDGIRLISDDPREMRAHRNMERKRKAVGLLGKMGASHASQGDETMLSDVLAASIEEIVEAAGEGAERIIAGGQGMARKAVEVEASQADGNGKRPPRHSLRHLERRLHWERARAAEQYDKGRRILAEQHDTMQAREDNLTPEIKGLRKRVRAWLDTPGAPLDERTAGVMLRYLRACHQRGRAHLARLVAWGGKAPLGTHAAGRLIGSREGLPEEDAVEKAARPGLVLQASKKNPRVRRWMSTEVEAQPTERVRHPEATGQARAVARAQPEAAQRAAAQERMAAAAPGRRAATREKPLPSEGTEAPVVAPARKPGPRSKVGKLIAGLEALEAKRAWAVEEAHQIYREARVKWGPLTEQWRTMRDRETELRSLGDLTDELRAELSAITLQIPRIRDEVNRIHVETTEQATEMYAIRNETLSRMRKLLEPANPLPKLWVNADQVRANYRSMYKKPPSKKKMEAQIEEWSTILSDVSRLIGDDALRSYYRNVKLSIMKGDRASYDHATETILADQCTGARTLAHELGHWLEKHSAVIEQRARAFLRRRTEGEALQRLSTVTKDKGYRPDEVTRPDRFMDPYMGKHYEYANTGVVAHTEIVSMGLEYLYTQPLEFAREDPEYFEFMIDVLREKEG